MKNITNILLAVIIVLSVGLYFKQSVTNVTNPTQFVAGASSPVGVSNSTRKMASITMAPLTASATSTSILNTDSTDRMITSTEVSCSVATTTYTAYTGAGLANWNVKVATTSTAITGAIGDSNTNYYSNVNIATSSVASNPGVASANGGYTYVASSTEGVITYLSRLWPTNTYATIQFNATNTAACTVDLNYIPL